MVWPSECTITIMFRVRIKSKEDHMAPKKLKKGKKLGKSTTLKVVYNMRGRK